MNYNLIHQFENVKPKKDKVLFRTENKTISHWEFYQLVRKYAYFFNNHINQNDRVLLVLYDSIDALAIFYSLLYVGAVPIISNARARINTLVSQYEICKPALSIVERDDLTFPNQLEISKINLGKELEQPVHKNYNDLAYMLWTSGTSGRWKLVMYAHGRQFDVTKILAESMHFSSNSKTYCTAKMSFILHLNTAVFNPMFNGGESYIDSGLSTPGRVQFIIDSYKPNVFVSIPLIYAQLLSQGRLSQESIVYHSGGERLPTSIIDGFLKTTKQKIVNHYGSTEMACPCLLNFTGNSSVGKPIPGYEIRIVDEQGNLCQIDQIGSLEIKSNIKTIGYFDDIENTDPMYKNDWSRTNDMASIDSNGMVWHHGRSGDIIKINGQYINPLDIEEVLLTHSDIEQAAVVIKQGHYSLEHIEAFVVLKQTSNTNQREIRAWLRNNYDGSFLRIINIVETLPRTDNGKIQRYKLRENITW